MPSWGNVSGRISSAPLPAMKFNRASAAAEPLLTSVMVVFQRPPEATCGMLPAATICPLLAALCSTVNASPAAVIVPERAEPVFGATW